MARKIQDTVKYFPHDCDASEGDTLTIIEAEFGNDGYAFWFKLLEKLGKSNGHYIDCKDPKKLATLSAKAHITSEKGITIVEMLADLEAIDKELWKHKVIWCQHFVDNVSLAYSNRRRDPPSKPIITSSNQITTSSNSTDMPKKKITTCKSTQTKRNETKRNNTKALQGDAAALKDYWIMNWDGAYGLDYEGQWLKFIAKYPPETITDGKALIDKWFANLQSKRRHTSSANGGDGADDGMAGMKVISGNDTTPDDLPSENPYKGKYSGATKR